ncbi:MAG: hypothetical protein V1927_00485 [Candidatus Omnitrophota bacterium]
MTKKGRRTRDLEDMFEWEYFKEAEAVYNKLKKNGKFLKDLQKFLIVVGRIGGIDRIRRMNEKQQLAYHMYIHNFYKRWGLQDYMRGGLGFEYVGVEFYPANKPVYMKLVIGKDVGVKELVNLMPFYMGLRNAVLRKGEPIKKGKSEEGLERNCGMYAFYHSPEITHLTEQERLQKVKDRFRCGYLSDDYVKHVVHDKKRYSRQ